MRRQRPQASSATRTPPPPSRPVQRQYHSLRLADRLEQLSDERKQEQLRLAAVAAAAAAGASKPRVAPGSGTGGSGSSNGGGSTAFRLDAGGAVSGSGSSISGSRSGGGRSGGGRSGGSGGSGTRGTSGANSAGSTWVEPKAPVTLPKRSRQCPVAHPVDWSALPRDANQKRAAVFTPYNIVRWRLRRCCARCSCAGFCRCRPGCGKALQWVTTCQIHCRCLAAASATCCQL